MKTKHTMKKILALCVTGLLGAQLGMAQLNKVDFIKGGLDNGQILLKEYVRPWANSLGASLNGGWYNTAKPHKLGGFDLTITINTTLVPDAAKTFDLSKLSLTDLELTDPNDAIASTIAGPKGEGPELSYVQNFNGTDYTVASFNTPGGTGVGVLPLPMVQFGLGLVKGTDVTVRYLPRLNIFNAGSIGLWGVGIKHSIIQWLPGSSLIPFELSAFGAYTRLSSMADINFLPSSYIGVPINLVNYTDADFDDQQIAMDMTAWTVNLIASKSLAILTVYGGAGYSSTKANLKMTGNYPLTQLNVDNPGNPFVEVADGSIVKDPIDIEVKSFSGLRLNAGLRLKLALLTIHFDYTYADYSVYTAGLGVSFR